MTNTLNLNENTPQINYIGDGEQTQFFFPFMIFNLSDVDVYHNQNLLQQGYSVEKSASASGGTVTFKTVPANGDEICLVRTLEVKRVSDFQEGVEIRSKVLNHELNYQMACIQQVAGGLNRSFLLPPYANTNFSNDFPIPSPHKAIVWNAEGNALVNSEIEVGDIDRKLQETFLAIQDNTDTVIQLSQEVVANTTIVETAAAETKNTAAELTELVETSLQDKADADFSKISAENARQLIGNRVWISEEYDFPPQNTCIVANHNLNVPIEYARGRLMARCKVANNNFKVGEAVEVSCDNQINGVYPNPILLRDTTIIGSRSNKCLFAMPTNGLTPYGLELNAAQWKLFFIINY